MAIDNSKTPTTPQPQNIPLAKIHDLPGVTIFKQPDKSYGGLVTSIQAGGVKEPVILRLREDGEYQLVTGYRRRKASELAKKQEIPALVYEMTLQEAADYHRRVQVQSSLPIPGKLVESLAEKAKEQAADIKEAEKSAAGDKEKVSPPAAEPAKDGAKESPVFKVSDMPPVPAVGDKVQEPPPAKTPQPTAEPAKDSKDKVPVPKTPDTPPAPAAEDKAKETPPVKAPQPTAEPSRDSKDKAPAPKGPDTPPVPADGDKTKKSQPAKTPPPTAIPSKDSKDKAPAPKGPATPSGSADGDKAKETPSAEPAKVSPATSGPAAKGPAGTAISQVLPERLLPPDEKAKKDIPNPKADESFFIRLHPAYLEKSKYNTVSVDPQSEDYQELKKSIELNGVKDPVLARIGEAGTLEIVSGQRRHMIATELGYAVPTIIQKIDDADVKILVADGNLHRPHISTYDLSRTLRMKMEGMKQKSGRRKKGAVKVEELDSDVKLAQEMGMKVSKLNRILRLSEASKDVCDRVDDGSLALSIASAISFLKPANQDEVLHLSDLGYKVTNERVERMKKAEKSGKLDEKAMRDILEDKDLAPRQTTPPPTPKPSEPPVPPSPDVKTTPEPTASTPAAPAATAAPVPETAAPTESKPEAPASVPNTDTHTQPAPATPPGPAIPPAPAAAAPPANTPAEKTVFKGEQERPEYTKVVLAGDRLRKYFPDVSMTPREIEESVYDALEERRQRQLKAQQKESIFKGKNPAR